MVNDTRDSARVRALAGTYDKEMELIVRDGLKKSDLRSSHRSRQ